MASAVLASISTTASTAVSKTISTAASAAVSTGASTPVEANCLAQTSRTPAHTKLRKRPPSEKTTGYTRATHGLRAGYARVTPRATFGFCMGPPHKRTPITNMM